jgi:hypothetical protein
VKRLRNLAKNRMDCSAAIAFATTVVSLLNLTLFIL